MLKNRKMGTKKSPTFGEIWRIISIQQKHQQLQDQP